MYRVQCRCNAQLPERLTQQGVGHFLSTQMYTGRTRIWSLYYSTVHVHILGVVLVLLCWKYVKIFAFNCSKSLHIMLNHVPDGIYWSAWSFCEDICWQKIPLEVQVPTKSLTNAKTLSHTTAWAGVSFRATWAAGKLTIRGDDVTT